MAIFKDPDFDATQLLYGFVLIALAIVITTIGLGNVVLLSAVLALLLIKDGMPNFVVGAMKVAHQMGLKEKKEA